jgi:hypothetical protein
MGVRRLLSGYQLLPELARYFEVSVDALLGYEAADPFGGVC